MVAYIGFKFINFCIVISGSPTYNTITFSSTVLYTLQKYINVAVLKCTILNYFVPIPVAAWFKVHACRRHVTIPLVVDVTFCYIFLLMQSLQIEPIPRPASSPIIYDLLVQRAIANLKIPVGLNCNFQKSQFIYLI